MFNATKTRSGVIHQEAGCNKCGWQNSHWRHAGRLARRHTQNTGHKTWVETGTSYYYTVDGGEK